MGIKVVLRPKLSFTERIYLGPIVKRLRLTIGHFFGTLTDVVLRRKQHERKTSITMQYPEERWDFKDNHRGAPVLVMDTSSPSTCLKRCSISAITGTWSKASPPGIRIPPSPSSTPRMCNWPFQTRKVCSDFGWACISSA